MLSTLHAASPVSEHLEGPDGDFGNEVSPQRRIRRPSTNGAEDAARELEESLLGPSKSTKGKGKGKEVKRPASRAPSEASSSDLDIPIAKKASHANKKRKLGLDTGDITADLERSIADDQKSAVSVQDGSQKPTPVLKGRNKSRGKQIQQREQSMDSISATPKASRKRPGPRRKMDTFPPQTQEHLGIASATASVTGDVTPVGSRPASPSLTATSATVFYLDEAIPPLKKAKKVDEVTMLKRVKALEEAQRKVWKNIARREVAKVIPPATSLRRKLTMLSRSINIMQWAISSVKHNSSV